MDLQLFESLVIAGSWFGLVWFATSALLVIMMQALLPSAWKQIRARPPHGPGLANALWNHRSRVYGTIMTLSLALGVMAGGLSLLFG
ncbi:MAG: hypothetical protein ACPGWR_26325 [Ardenticatenaceae bacterium]